MKREIFLVPVEAKGGRFPETEAGLLARLESDEQFLLRHHPHAASQPWRFMISMDGSNPRDCIAAELYDRLIELRELLAEPQTPAWLAAHAGIKYQNLVMIYRQPNNASARGRLSGKEGNKTKQEIALELSSWLAKWLKARGWTVADLKVTGRDKATRDRLKATREAFGERFGESLATPARFRAARESLDPSK
jgi:hypothetical protein